jgi:hypothetical protein
MIIIINTIILINEVLQGYVDDPRNTDNAWLEARATSYHDEDGKVFALITIVSKVRLNPQTVK